MTKTGNVQAVASYFGGRATLVPLSQHEDERGVLLPIDFREIPFEPCRSFVVSGSYAGAVRGGHGHRAARQMLVCLQGSIEILMRHNAEEIALTLAPGSAGLVFGPGVWCQQTYAQPDSILLVLASEPYDPASYID